MAQPPDPLDTNDLVVKYGWPKVLAGLALFLLAVAAIVASVVYAHDLAKSKGTPWVLGLALLGGVMSALGAKLSKGAGKPKE